MAALADAPRSGSPLQADAAYVSALEQALGEMGESWGKWRKKVRAEPERYELHYQDETHLETNPYLCRVWHRQGTQPTLLGVGTNRLVTVFGSVEALAHTRIEQVRGAGHDRVRALPGAAGAAWR